MADSWMALYIAYTVVWVGLLAYMAYIHIQERSVEKEIAALEKLVNKDAK